MPDEPWPASDASGDSPTTAPVTPPGAPPSESPGTQIGPYRLLERLGEGGFGSVFLAEQESPVRRRVALKIIKAGMDTGQVIARFEAERQALAMMDHPSIAKVLDAGATATGRPYFVMEYVKGLPITQFCDNNNLGTRERLSLFRQVCNAVQHAHQKGIIHRDLKPSNILVTSQDGAGLPKVIDFGIAKATSARLTEKTLFTELRQLIGTPEYMSPEQTGVSGGDIDTRSDIYSLGVLLYQLLTGTTPFEGARLRSAAFDEVQRIIRDEDPPKPSTRVSTMGRTVLARTRDRKPSQSAAADAPAPQPTRPPPSLDQIARHRRTEPAALHRTLRGELDWIVMKAMEKDRTRRYETANGLGADIGRYLEGQAVLAVPPSAGYLARKFIRRHRVPVIAGSFIALALLTGAAVATVGFISALKSRDAEAKAKQNETTQRVLAEQAKAEAETQRNEALRQRDATEFARAAETTQRKRAEANQQTAEAINSFLQTMLSSADPRKEGRNVTVAEAIDVASRSVGDSFKGRPEVEAGVRAALAHTYLSLGMPDKAEPHVNAALAIHTRLYGEENADTIRDLSDLASLHSLRAEHAQAVAILEKTLPLSERVLGPEHGRTLGILGDLANNLRQLNRLDESEAIFRRVLEVRRNRAPADAEDSSDLIITLNSLAVLLHDREQLDEAEALYRESLDLCTKAYGPDHPDTLIAHINLASIDASRKKHQEALTELKEILPRVRTVFGDRHEKTAGVLWAIGYSYSKLGRPVDALPAYRECLDIYQGLQSQQSDNVVKCKVNIAECLFALGDFPGAVALRREVYQFRLQFYGPGNERTIGAMVELAVALARTGADKECEDLYLQAMDQCARSLGKNHPRYINAVTGLGVYLHDKERFAEAEAAYREGLELGRVVNGPDAADTLISLYNVMGVVRDQGRLDEARPLAAEALAGFEHTFGPEHQYTASACSGYATVCWRQKDYTAAEPLFQRSLDIRRKALGPRSPSVATTLADLGAMHLEAGDAAGAEPFLRECLEIRQAATTPNERFTASARSELGECLTALSRFAEALPLLEEGRSGLESTRGPGHKSTVTATRRLVDLYTAWDKAEPGKGYDAKAAQWKDRLDAIAKAAAPQSPPKGP